MHLFEPEWPCLHFKGNIVFLFVLMTFLVGLYKNQSVPDEVCTASACFVMSFMFVY